ncbi:hypothetical protein P153DRAFT_368378 [Dothidotthia symphoricarpi CBS 119687]|uniref:Uncharacterized protein n=1 Tax=Dothidotthia symphoricarpi CBS 119687 TaxID=1392245 RepID=A0A6A6AAU7_9PLEO|nr:uncharacterized protein P153DRAFT_368378 [Dothidotthia symphoricarpi CBS 119687]KAF2127831.1 hypothetical protein P153DRAFT_368378 [Dothidotthia symphoricarpi CBS 119687]
MSPAPLFLTLPGEVRNLIVEYAFVQDLSASPLPVSRSPLALSLVSRQLFHEYHTVALSATVFTIRCRRLSELPIVINKMPPMVRSHLKKLLLSGKFNLSASQRLGGFQGIDLSDAGLTGVRELHFSPSTDTIRRDHPCLNPRILGQVIWRTVVGNACLETICVVHKKSRSYPIEALSQLMEMEQLRCASDNWTVLVNSSQDTSRSSMDFDENSGYRCDRIILRHKPEGRQVIIAFRQDAAKKDISSRVREKLLGIEDAR